MSIILALINHVCSLGIPFINAVINVFIRRVGNTSILWMLPSVRTNPTFLLAIFKGRVSEKSNNTIELIKPAPSTVFDFDPHPIILPTNQAPWKTYYMRNLIKEVIVI